MEKDLEDTLAEILASAKEKQKDSGDLTPVMVANLSVIVAQLNEIIKLLHIGLKQGD